MRSIKILRDLSGRSCEYNIIIILQYTISDTSPYSEGPSSAVVYPAMIRYFFSPDMLTVYLDVPFANL